MEIKNKELAHYFQPIKGTANDFDSVIDHIAEAKIVLLGEATHGTHEFYKARIDLSKRLILEKKFRTIAIEGDFPDVYRINQYINFQGDDRSALESLSDFKRFPLWMWRNEEMLAFIDWLREYNHSKSQKDRVSLYGLDLYSIYSSIAIVIEQLEKIDPAAAREAKKRYQCFDVYPDPQQYGYMASIMKNKSCQEEVGNQYLEIIKKEVDQFRYDTMDPEEKKFYLQQNALLICNAEHYYRSLFSENRSASWNLRDKHMMQVLESIEKYNKSIDKDYEMVVWAHNSHVGDARATQMSSYGELNVGQLAKELYGPDAVSIGFTTYSGTVSAASAWDGPVEQKKVRPALPNSIERFFHEIGLEAFIAIPAEHPALYELFSRNDYLERAIGVIYLPQSERQSHYFYANLAQQFDIIIHYDSTHAVKPLEYSAQWEKGEHDTPETFPFGT